MNIPKLTILAKKMMGEVDAMRNEIGTGPTIMGVKTFSSNKQRYLMLDRYEEIRTKYYTLDPNMRFFTSPFDIAFESHLSDPLVRSTDGIRCRNFDHMVVELIRGNEVLKGEE